MTLFDELLCEAKHANLDREFEAIHVRSAQLRELQLAGASAMGGREVGGPLPDTTTTYPWGDPGHGFVGRRRAWLHKLLASGSADPRPFPER